MGKIKAEEVKEDEDEELAEAEEDSEDNNNDDEFIEESLEIPESDFEVSDFSIGDIGLATANVETSWKGNLESSLAEEPPKMWEERDKELEKDSLKGGIYGASSLSDNYDGNNSGRGLYAENKGGSLYAENNGGDSYGSGTGAYGVGSATNLKDIKEDKGEEKFWSETRLPGMSRLENKSLDQVDGVFVEGYGGKKQKIQK